MREHLVWMRWDSYVHVLVHHLRHSKVLLGLHVTISFCTGALMRQRSDGMWIDSKSLQQEVRDYHSIVSPCTSITPFLTINQVCNWCHYMKRIALKCTCLDSIHMLFVNMALTHGDSIAMSRSAAVPDQQIVTALQPILPSLVFRVEATIPRTTLPELVLPSTINFSVFYWWRQLTVKLWAKNKQQSVF